MDSPDPPPPPNPFATAAAQTGSNVSTALANSVLGNANEQSPYGNVNYSQSGNFTTITDELGRTYQIPQFNRSVTLSPEQQQLYNQQTRLGGDLNNLAISQVGRLSGVLGQPLDTSTLPGAVNSIGMGPQFPGAASTPILRSVLPGAGAIRNSIAGAGPLSARSISPRRRPRSAHRRQHPLQRRPQRLLAGPPAGRGALMARLNPQLDRDREGLRTRDGIIRNDDFNVIPDPTVGADDLDTGTADDDAFVNMIGADTAHGLGGNDHYVIADGRLDTKTLIEEAGGGDADEVVLAAALPGNSSRLERACPQISNA